MPKDIDKKSYAFDRSGIYRIRVLGFIDESWSESLGDLRITTTSLKDQEGPVTVLVGKVRDQAELAGILNTLYAKLWDGVVLVRFISFDQSILSKLDRNALKQHRP